MNQQQETLNKEIEIPGRLIASISRSIGRYLTNYTIYFYMQEEGFLVPEIGVTVIFDRRMPYPMVGAIIDTIRKENMRGISVEDCLEDYQRFITQDSTKWADKLVDIEFLAMLVDDDGSWMMDEEMSLGALQDLAQYIMDVIPRFCFYVNRGGDFSYEW